MKSKQAPIQRTQTYDPAKMRQDIIRQFETLPDDLNTTATLTDVLSC